MKEIKVEDIKNLDEAQLKSLYWEVILNKVKKDPYFWLTNYVYTFNPDSVDNPKQRFPDKEFIKKVVKIWLEKRILFVVKSRQIMGTWLFVALHLWDVMYHAGKYCLFQSAKESKAGWGGSDDQNRSSDKAHGSPLTLLGRADFIYSNLPQQLRIPRIINREPPMMKFIHNIDGQDMPSIIEAMSSAGSSARTFTITNGLLDEMAFMPEAEESFGSIVPSLSKVVGVGKLTALSTVNGKEFFEAKFNDRL